MKHRAGKWLVMVTVGLLLAGRLLVPPVWAADAASVQAVADTRQLLRQQGFKTDLSEFDLSTTPELRACEAILTNTFRARYPNSFPEHPNLMQPVGNDSALVVWQQDSLSRDNRSRLDESDRLSWEEFRGNLELNQPLYDDACSAILAGPIRFQLDASQGSHVRLAHLAVMKNLAQTFGDRTLVALHDGNSTVAWTNLLAATRLVTAWTPEPVEVSHLVRFALAVIAYNLTWQALQTNNWSEAQIARLQQEWESVDYFSGLPETIAFKRAGFVADCERERTGVDDPPPTFSEFAKRAIQYPASVWNELNYRWERAKMSQRGIYDLEKDMMLFFRDREVELRNAVKAPTWAAMRPLPGVTNYVPFRSQARSRVQSMMNVRELNMAFQRQGFSFMGRAANIEAQRRILITALALERYRLKHGSYPNDLSSLAPEFLKTVPVDFMDGQPLRYRLKADGHFLLYSVGLDCEDNGGKMRDPIRRDMFDDGRDFMGRQREPDIVWPLPATTEEIAVMAMHEERVKELQNRRDLERESAMDWDMSSGRLLRTEKILAAQWSPDTGRPSYQGRPLSDVIRNEHLATGTNRLSLAEMLTPRQVFTGREPEDFTFEFPVNYDSITNLGALVLLVDAEMDMPTPNAGGRIQETSRTTNGNCLLIWHTIFDPPGRHAVQAQLIHTDWRVAEYCSRGPAIPVTTSNLCQFSLDSSTYDTELGATFHARLPETNGLYTIECVTTNGAHLKTFSGSTTNGEFKVIWDLVPDQGQRLTGETFNSIVTIKLPDSGRTQTLRGP